MIFSDMLATAISNLGRRKVRTALTSTGVVVGILTIVTMVSLGVGVQREVQAQFASLGLENIYVRPTLAESDTNFFNQFGTPARQKIITPTDIERWRTQPGVVTVFPQIDISGVTISLELACSQGVPCATGATKGSAGRVAIVSAQNINFNTPLSTAPTAIAGTLAVTRPGTLTISRGALPKGGDPQSFIGQSVTLLLRSPRGEEQRFTLQVVGVSDRTQREVRALADDMLSMKAWWYNQPDYLAAQGYDSVLIRAQNVQRAAELVKQLGSEGYEVQSLELILNAINRVFAVINVMLSSIGGLALFVASIGIVNTMIMAIYERTREIGTLKAIGASQSDIRGIFMLEAGMIGLLGGIVGVIGGWLVGIGLNMLINWYIERERLPVQATFFVVPWWLALAGLAFAALVGILAGLYPATRAARLDPLVALRYE